MFPDREVDNFRAGGLFAARLRGELLGKATPVRAMHPPGAYDGALRAGAWRVPGARDTAVSPQARDQPSAPDLSPVEQLKAMIEKLSPEDAKGLLDMLHGGGDQEVELTAEQLAALLNAGDKLGIGRDALKRRLTRDETTASGRSQEDIEGRRGGDQPPPFPGRPTPGSSPLPLRGAQDAFALLAMDERQRADDAKRRAVAAFNRSTASSRASAGYFERFPSSKRIGIG